MHAIDLNHDVLGQICSYFYGSKAINLTLVCRHIYRLAIHRVVAEVHCDSAGALHKIHRVLFPDPPARSIAKSVERLFIQHRGLWPSSTGDSQMFMILEILNGATNLIVLKLDFLPPVISTRVALLITQAIASLHRLAVLDVREMDNTTLYVPQELRSHRSLRTLALAASFDPTDPSAARTFAGLSELLAGLPKVHRLAMEGVPWNHIPTPAVPSHARHHSVRELILRTSPRMLDLVFHFPNISCVAFFELSAGPDLTPYLPDISLTGRRWPPLREFILTSFWRGITVLELVNTVDFLVIHQTIRIPFNAHAFSDREQLIALWRITSPIGVAFALVISGSTPITLFGEIASAPTTRLRFMLLTLPLFRYDMWPATARTRMVSTICHCVPQCMLTFASQHRIADDWQVARATSAHLLGDSTRGDIQRTRTAVPL